MRRAEILLLHDRPVQIAQTVLQHLDALTGFSRNRVSAVPLLGDLPPGLDLNRFDAVVLHYSLVICHDSYVSPQARRDIASCSALKVVFIQDEYKHVDATVAALHEMGIDLLFTCVPEGEIEKVYPAERLPGLRKVNVLTGYVDPDLVSRAVPPLQERPVDIGYRARKVPAWLGDLGQEKWNIGQRVAAEADAFDLTCDFGYREEERLYGEAWIKFLTGCKAVLGVESGASVFDFTGEIQRNVQRDLAEDPSIPYEVLRARHFAHEEGRIRLNQISPRCFEAAALRTLMILYEGEYSGILEAGRHYIPLRKDHANMAEVVATLRDPAAAQAIVDTTYREVACNPKWSFQAFVAKFDDEVAVALARKTNTARTPYTDAEIERFARGSFSTRRRKLQSRVIWAAYLFLFRDVFGWMPEQRRDKLYLKISKAAEAGSRAVLRILAPFRT